jgi:myo-inositol catabolism protein IolC
VLLGLDAPLEDLLEKAFAMRRRRPMVKGFAVGRTITSHAASNGWPAR